jgi:hypothetical protein
VLAYIVDEMDQMHGQAVWHAAAITSPRRSGRCRTKGGKDKMTRIRILIAAALALTSPGTQAAEQKTLILSCQGARWIEREGTPDYRKRMPITIGLVVDFAARTVAGFGPDMHITDIDANSIEFGDRKDRDISRPGHFISGRIDRITGTVTASDWDNDRGTLRLMYSTEFSCKPVERRMF